MHIAILDIPPSFLIVTVDSSGCRVIVGTSDVSLSVNVSFLSSTLSGWIGTSTQDDGFSRLTWMTAYLVEDMGRALALLPL